MRLQIEMVDRDALGLPPLPMVTLLLRSSVGDWATAPFVVDTGADFMAIPTALADIIGLRYRTGRRGTVRGLVGSTERFRDAVHVRLFGEIHRWDCDFIRSPAQYGVLGRGDFLRAVDVCHRAPYLHLIRRGTWVRRVMDIVRQPWHRLHLADEPL